MSAATSYYLLKIAVSAVLIALISEVARRSAVLGAILASVPLVSVLAMIWLYVDTGDSARVAALASGIFWLVLPSLALFLALPLLLRYGLGFYPSLGLSIILTVGCYFLMLTLLRHLGVTI